MENSLGPLATDSPCISALGGVLIEQCCTHLYDVCSTTVMTHLEVNVENEFEKPESSSL